MSNSKKSEALACQDAGCMPKADENMQDSPVFLPLADIWDEGDAVKLYLEVPGVSSDALDIRFDNGKLTVVGRQKDQRPEGCELIHWGYTTGIFRRSFSLSSDLDANRIAAKLKDGVLELTLPKNQKASPKKIKVSAE